MPLIEHYLDLIEQTESEDADFLEHLQELERVRHITRNPGLCAELPEDFDLHAEHYHQGELIDYHGR